jgi:hypothetical protein
MDAIIRAQDQDAVDYMTNIGAISCRQPTNVDKYYGDGSIWESTAIQSSENYFVCNKPGQYITGLYFE